MREVIAVVEGATEREFVHGFVAPWLITRGVRIRASVVGKPGKKGGAKHWEVFLRDVRAFGAQRATWCITMAFDLYGLHRSWPGVAEVAKCEGQRATKIIEDAVRHEVGNKIPAVTNRFIPYIQCHEFEALLFADGSAFTQVLGLEETVAKKIDEVRTSSGGCESIDGGADSAPSKRLIALAPAYNKTLHPVPILQKIGLPNVRSQCPHFDAWMAKLEALANA